MEELKKKKDWIKNATIIFLAVLLVLTFSSKTIMNYSLPEVSAQYAREGNLTNMVKGTGVVESADPYSVIIKEARMVESVRVRVGDEVQKGDVIYVLEAGDSDELKKAKKELEKLESEYDQAIITNEIKVSASNAVENGTMPSITSIQTKLEAAKSKVDNAQNTLDSLNRQKTQMDEGTVTYVPELKNKEEAQKNYNAWSEQKTLESSALASKESAKTSAEATLNAAKVTLASAQTTYDSVSDSDPSTVDLDAALAAVATAQSNYNSAVEAYNHQSEIYKTTCDRLDEAKRNLDNASQAIDDRKYSISLQITDATKALEDAKKEREELKTELSNQYGLEDKLREIEDKKEEVEKLESEYTNNEITSPVNGTILTLPLTAGMKTETGATVATLQRAGKAYTFVMTVTNDQAKLVKIGDEAEVANSWWYTDVHAKLINITADPDKPTTHKKLTFDLEGDVTGGQSLTLSVGSRTMSYDCIIPNSAIREDNNGKFVLTVEPKDTPLGTRYIATRSDVTVLATDGTASAVNGDLSSWAFVITTSTKPIEPGTQVRLKDQ